MEDHAVAPEEICAAIENSGEADVATVRQWLDDGGDANAFCYIGGWESVLQRAARVGSTEMLSLLLSRGADIDLTDRDNLTALYYLLNYFRSHRSISALRVLLSNGADVNLARSGEIGSVLDNRSPLITAVFAGGPNILRLLMRAGADPEHRTGDGFTAEEHARNRPAHSYLHHQSQTETANFLRDVRLAGGWVRYALQPHYGLLVLRALCHRGRATFRLFSARTPEVLVRLFGAPEAQGRKYTIRGRVDLPDPLFWRVLEFALGPVYDYPWVRQRVRARAAAVAAAE
jgi:hypothetical protein